MAVWLVLWLAVAEAPPPNVSINAVAQPLGEVLAALGRETGRPIRLDPRILDQPITLEVRGQPLPQALDLISRAAGLIWYEHEGVAYLTFEPTARAVLADLGDVPLVALRCPPAMLARPVTLGLLNVPLRDAFRALQEPTGAIIDIDPGVPYDIHITANFQATPLSRCLYMLCVTSGVYLVPGEGPRLRVAAPVRVAATRADRDTAVAIEHFPPDYRGALGYLLVDAFWAAPERFRSRVLVDAWRQPQVAQLEPPPAGSWEPGVAPR